MPSPRDVRRAAKRLVSASRRIRAARSLNAADFDFALKVVRREQADRELAGTPLSVLAERGADAATIEALRDEFATVLDVATADLPDLARLPGVDLSHVRTLRSEARKMRAALAASTAPRFTPEDPTTAQTTLLRTLRRRVVADRATGHLRESTRAFAKQARHLIPLSRVAASPALRAIAGATTIKRSRQALRELTELTEPHLAADTAGQIARALRRARVLPVPSETVWEEFRAHPGEFYDVIEQGGAGPRRAPRDYGPMPGELAARIVAAPLDLSLLHADLNPSQEFAARLAIFQGRLVLCDAAALDPTLEALAAMAHLAANGERHVLVLAPARRHAHWTREVKRRTGLTAISLAGRDRRSGLTEWRAVGGVAIGTDEALGAPGSFRTDSLGLLVIDEAHHVASARHEASQRVIDVIGRADRVLLLSDRTIEKNRGDVAALVGIARPDLEASLGDDVPEDVFRARVAPAYLARTAHDDGTPARG